MMSGMKRGTTHSDETKEKIRQRRIEFYANGGVAPNGMKGKQHTPESLERMSRANIEKGNHKNFGDTSGANNPAWRGGIEHVRETRRKYRASRPWSDPYYGSRARAKRSGVPHEITLTEFIEWFEATPKICGYCDRDISQKTDSRMDNASIDRKHNERGYTLVNICFACNRCNTVKGNVFTYDQMREIAQKYLTSV